MTNVRENADVCAQNAPSLAAFALAPASATSTAAANHKIYGDSYFQQCAHAELNFIASPITIIKSTKIPVFVWTLDVSRRILQGY